MANILKLKNPIMIDNKPVAELTYDSNEIDGILFAEAESKRREAGGKKFASFVPAPEVDFTLQVYLGFAAIIAVNRSYDFADLQRIKGSDVKHVYDIGRNFILASDAEQPQSDSDAPDETTPESTTQAQASSKESE